MTTKKSEKLIDKKGIRLDGRKVDELRPVKMQIHLRLGEPQPAF